MQKTVFITLIVILSGVVAYDHKDELISHSKFILKDPSELVLNANIPETDTIYSFNNSIYGEIFLLSGKEETFGFRHILARHTKRYFINYTDKNNATLFDDEASGKDILLGLEKFYENCIDIPSYSTEAANLVYIGFTEIEDKKIKCLLVIKRENNQIVTFYPFNQEEFDRRRRDNTRYD
jgi:hypothetical protein